jgi:hypothetical protein
MKDVNLLSKESRLMDVDFESNFSNLGFFNTMFAWLNPILAIQYWVSKTYLQFTLAQKTPLFSGCEPFKMHGKYIHKMKW